MQLCSIDTLSLDSEGTGLLSIAQKVGVVARAYEYQAGSDRVRLQLEGLNEIEQFLRRGFFVVINFFTRPHCWTNKIIK